MSEVHQVEQDLRFVREAVARRDRGGGAPAGILYLWAAYVAIGYTMIDFWPRLSGPFFAIGGVAGGILSWQLGKWYGRRTGEANRTEGIEGLLLYGGGIWLIVAFVIALSSVAPPVRPYSGQLVVGMIGLIYFSYGVYRQRYYLLLGPLVMAGGVAVGLVPYFGWTALGLLISVGIVLPTWLPSRTAQPAGAGAAPPGGEAA